MTTMQVYPTGGDDYGLLHKAAQKVSDPNCKGTVELCGDYKLSQPWVIGDPDNSNVPSVSVVARHHAVLRYTGPQTDQPLLQVYGRLMSTQLRNVVLECNWKCRGILFANQTYNSAIDNVRVRCFRQLGLDVAGSYVGSLRGIDIRYGKGMGLRVVGSNATRVEQVAIEAVTAEDWPADVLPEDRSLACFDSQCVQMTGLTFESCESGEQPLLLLKGRQYEIDGMYLESNTATDCKVLIPGAAQDQGRYHFAFRNVLLDDSSPCKSFIRTNRCISDISVDGLRAMGLADGIILCDGGHHYEHSVRHCRTGDATIPREYWVRAINGAVLHDQAPEGLDHMPIPTTP